MFTGIVEGIARIDDVRDAGTARTFRIATNDAFRRAKFADGESIAVNGVCLTVEQSGVDWFQATAVEETLKRTTLGSLRKDSRVNLERAATAATLLGGHIVQGHVDGVGRVVEFGGSEAGDRRLALELPEDVYELCAEKGSITVDGISLTVARKLEHRRIEIAIVPYTMEKTIANEYVSGRAVNVEADVIARYVREQLRKSSEFIGRIEA
ncbi:MAG TPA: riboflavin synthase [Candidatus Krumholzibacteria bacterium]|nr:riboflavin synthase [Candidatus Krumholzibacteria bacterium]